MLKTPEVKAVSAIADADPFAVSFAATSDSHGQCQAWPPQSTHAPGQQNPSRVAGAGTMRRALDQSIPMNEMVRGLMERLEAATSEVVRQRGLAMTSGQEVLDVAEEKAVLEGKFFVSQNDLRNETERVERLEQDLTRAREGQRRAEHMAWLAIQALERETRRSGAETEQTTELEEDLRELVKHTALQQGHNWRVAEEMAVLEGGTQMEEDRRGAVVGEDGTSERQIRRVWGVLMEKVAETDRREAEAREKCAAVSGELAMVTEQARRSVGAVLAEVEAARRWVNDFMTTYEAEGQQGQEQAEAEEMWGLTQGLASDLCASRLAVAELKERVEEAAQSSASMQRELESEQRKVLELMSELADAQAAREKGEERASEVESALRREVASALEAS
eukprot:2598875-Rhodomonas_salina.1